MLGTSIFSLLLIGLSGLLLDIHRRSWRAAQADDSISRSDLLFARSQYRRRMQASGIIGVLGVAIAIGPVLPRDPVAVTFYLGAILIACVAIMFLAALDAWATRQNLLRLRSEQLAAQVKLARELRRDRAVR